MQRVVASNGPAVEETGEDIVYTEEGQEDGDTNVEIVLDSKVVAGEGNELLRRPRRLTRYRDSHGPLLDDAEKLR